MPRLTAALAVLLTMGVCIGFNTIRYPVVWQMVGQFHPWPASPAPGEAGIADSPVPATSGGQTVSLPNACEAIHVQPGLGGPMAAAPVASPPKTRVVCNGSMCCVVHQPAPGPAAPPAAAVATSAPPARDAVPTAAAPEETIVAPLVPIIRPPRPATAAVFATALETASGDSDRPAQDKVRRLPSIDRVHPAQPASPQDELPADQIPLYPSTRPRPAG
jgi:hypothetical protein